MKLTMKRANTILGIVGILGGIIIIILAYIQELPFLRKGLPGAGFFPILCGIAIIFCSLLLLYENYSKLKKAKAAGIEDKYLESNIINNVEIRNFSYIVGSSILVIIMTQFIGLLISIGLSVVGLVKWMARESWQKSFLIGLGTTIVLYLTFKMFLGVSLPDSVIGF